MMARNVLLAASSLQRPRCPDVAQEPGGVTTFHTLLCPVLVEPAEVSQVSENHNVLRVLLGLWLLHPPQMKIV